MADLIQRLSASAEALHQRYKAAKARATAAPEHRKKGAWAKAKAIYKEFLRREEQVGGLRQKHKEMRQALHA